MTFVAKKNCARIHMSHYSNRSHPNYRTVSSVLTRAFLSPQVSDFTWSHDGTQALIAYRDGFVLVGSVSGQRHWSSEINLESQITCGIWTPDDQQVDGQTPPCCYLSSSDVPAMLCSRFQSIGNDPDFFLCNVHRLPRSCSARPTAR